MREKEQGSDRRSRILLIENNTALRQTLQEVLHLEGFYVICCANAAETLNCLQQDSFDAMVVDLRLPDLDEQQFLQKISPYFEEIPAIINTGYRSYESAKATLNLGATAYVEKASDPGELVRQIHRAVETQWRRRAQVLEEDFRNIFHLSRDLLCITDLRKATFIRVNSAFERILGYSSEELLKSSFFEFIHPDDVEQTKAAIEEELKKDKSAISFENRYRCKDGSYRLLSWTSQSQVDSGLTYAVGHDVTERKKMTMSLQRRADFETIITYLSSEILRSDDHDLDALIYKGLETIGRFYRTDHAYIFELLEDGRHISNTFEWCGQTIHPQIDQLQHIALDTELPWFAGQIQNLQPFIVESVEDLPREAELEKAQFQAQDIQSLVVIPMVVKKELLGFLGFDAVKNKRTWSDEDLNLLKIAGEIFAGAFVRREYAKNSIQERDKVQTYLDVAGVIMVALDANQRVTLINKKGRDILQCDQNRIIGENWFDVFVSERDRERTRQDFCRLMKGELESVAYFENAVLNAQGQERTIAWHNAQVCDHEGRIVGIFGSGKDITEQRQSEQQLRFHDYAIATCSEGVTITDARQPDNPVVYVNDCFLAMTGYPRDAVLGRNMRFLQGDVSNQEAVAQLSDAIAKEHAVAVELQNVRQDGSLLWNRVSLTPVRNDAGEVTHFVAVYTDVTERRRIEDQIRQNKEFYESIIESILNGVWVSDKNDVIYYTNKGMELIAGIPSEEIVGARVLTDFPEDTLAFFKPRYLKAKDTLEVVQYDAIPVTTPVGRSSYQSGWLVPKVKEGCFDGMICTVEDVTERHIAVNDLMKSEQRLKLAQEIGNIGDWSWDIASDRAEWSDQVYEIFQAPREEPSYEFAKTFVHPEDLELWQKTVQQAVTNQARFTLDYRAIRSDGETIWVHNESQTICNERGEFTGYLGTVQDITYIKMIEENLRQSQKELSVRNQIAEIFLTLTDDHAYAQVLNIILDVFESEFGTFGYFDVKDNFVCSGCTREAYWEKCDVPDKEIVYRHGQFTGIWGKAVEQKKMLIDNEGPFHVPDGHILIKNTMVAPILFNNKVISVVHIANKVDNYSEKDRAFLKDLADYIAPILNARLERHKAQNKLKKSEKKYKNLFDANMIGIGYWNLKGDITDCNDKFLEMIRYSREDLVSGKVRWIDLTPKEYAHLDIEGIKQIEERGYCDPFEKEYIRKDGSRIPVLIGGAMIEGVLDGCVAWVVDNTQKKKAEVANIEYQNKLKSMASQLSRVQEIERKNLSKQLHDNVSQRLTMAKLTLQQCAQSISDTDLSNKLEDVSTEMRRVVEDSYSLQLELSNPILYEMGLVAAVEMLLKSKLLKDQGIKYELITPDEPLNLHQDHRITLYQAIRELLVNIVKHAKAKEVDLVMQKEQDSLQISVKDDGIGFTPSIRKQPSQEGGFGLFNVNESLEGFGATVTIESNPGQGTAVIITIPYVCEPSS